MVEAAQDSKDALANDAAELEQLTGGKAPEKVLPTSPEELEKARRIWEERNKAHPEQYDVDYMLTSTQSRFEALQARGYVLLPADKDVTRAVIQAGKDSKFKAEQDAAAKKAAETAKAAQAADAAKAAEVAAKKEADAVAAKKKAEAFIKKMSK